MAKQFGPEPHLALDCASVRVEQQLGGVVAQAARRIIGPADARAVELPWLYPRNKAVPHVAVTLRQSQPFLGAVGIEQAQGHLLAVRRHSEVRAVRAAGRAQRRGCAGKNLGAHPFFSSITSRVVNAAVLESTSHPAPPCARMVVVMPRAFQNLSWYVTDRAATCLRQQPRESHGVAGNVDSNRRPERESRTDRQTRLLLTESA